MSDLSERTLVWLALYHDTGVIGEECYSAHAAECVRFVADLQRRKFDVRYLGANADGELVDPWRVQGVSFNGFAHAPNPLTAYRRATAPTLPEDRV